MTFMKNYTVLTKFGAERLAEILKNCIGLHYKCRGHDHATIIDASCTISQLTLTCGGGSPLQFT